MSRACCIMVDEEAMVIICTSLVFCTLNVHVRNIKSEVWVQDCFTKTVFETCSAWQDLLCTTNLPGPNFISLIVCHDVAILVEFCSLFCVFLCGETITEASVLHLSAWMRWQIHVLEDGAVKVFSRNQEDNTNKYPDIVRRMHELISSIKGQSVTSAVIDSEAVAWDRQQNCILPFQELSKRKRKVCCPRNQSTNIIMIVTNNDNNRIATIIIIIIYYL